MADISKADIKDQLQSTIASDLTDIKSRVSNLQNLCRRNIDQDRDLRTSINELTGKSEILRSVSSISSKIDGLETSINQLSTKIDSISAQLR